MLNLLLEWQKRILNVQGIQRECEDILMGAMNSKPIKIVTGFRRSGKSFLVQRIAKKMVENGSVKLQNILYLNFEDFHFMEINDPYKLDEIYMLYKGEIANEGKKLLIFDEIQSVKDWDRFIRTIYEQNDNIEILLTGSNSELLSSELGSNLAGRFIELQIFPFNFKEYLTFNAISFATEQDFLRNSEQIRKSFSDFVKYGGMPETFSISTEHARYSYLEGILSKVILDDIIKRFGVKNSFALERILLYLYSAIGNNISFNRITQFCKQLGINLKSETTITYIQHIIKTFALYEVSKFDWKLNKIFSTSRKYYAIDTGFINFASVVDNNYSKQLENIVFIHLKQRSKKIYFGELSNGKEIDFIAETRDGRRTKYQVTVKLHEDNYDRELSPFSFGNEHIKREENILLSMESEEKEILYNDIIIKKRNLLRWLLDL